MRPIFLVLAVLFAPIATAATLRPFTELRHAAVRLSDLFDGLEATPDPVLGPAPAPGERIVVEAPQLAAIARDFGVDWRPVSGAERAVLTRAGARLPHTVLLAALRAALADAGAPADADILVPGAAPLVADAATARPDITGVTYDAPSGRFTATLSVDQPDAPPLRVPLTGQAVVLQDASVLIHPVALGSIIGATDIARRRVPVRALAGHAPLAPEQVAGFALRRVRPLGAPLVEGDVTPPILVPRGSLVRLSLEAGAITLSAAATALDGGGVGDRIRAQNPSSRAIVQAVITGSGTARVLPGTAAPSINLAAAQ